MSFVINDSGARKEFDSGMVRDIEDSKIDYTLAFDGPMFERYAVHLTKGAKKYTRILELNLPNYLRLVNTCTCNKNVLISTQLDTSPSSVEAVMKGAYESVIRNLQKDNEKILVNGLIETEQESAILTAITSHLEDIEQNSSLNMGCFQKMNQKPVISVNAQAEIEPYHWITITKLAFQGVFSVNSATLLSVTSKTAQNYLLGHLSTCRILPFEVKENHIILPGARNWMKAEGEEEYERFKRSALRHMVQWLRGDTDEDHASATWFNVNGAEYVKEKILLGLLSSYIVDAVKQQENQIENKNPDQ